MRSLLVTIVLARSCGRGFKTSVVKNQLEECTFMCCPTHCNSITAHHSLQYIKYTLLPSSHMLLLTPHLLPFPLLKRRSQHYFKQHNTKGS